MNIQVAMSQKFITTLFAMDPRTYMKWNKDELSYLQKHPQLQK
jgi:hypothetical protein